MSNVRAKVETEAPAELLEELLGSTGYISELEASTDPQDESRVENLQELVSVAREFADRAGGRRRRSDHAGRVPRAGGAGRGRRLGAGRAGGW
nr:hypothetical protein [Fodinicola feengrottensis]